MKLTVIGAVGAKCADNIARKQLCDELVIVDIKVCQKVAADTMVGGATLTNLINTSAWYTPCAAGALLVQTFVRDEKRLISCFAAFDEEYGQIDIYLKGLLIIERNGWKKIIDNKLTREEETAFNKSADAIHSMNSVLSTLSL